MNSYFLDKGFYVLFYLYFSQTLTEAIANKKIDL